MRFEDYVNLKIEIKESLTYVDKSEWDSGPWTEEPDKIYFIDDETGYDCLIVRNNVGALCGYVAVNPKHKLYEIGYDNIEDIDIHGGLTYSDFCQDNKIHGICHPTHDENEDKVWWIGFDCSHVGDCSPDLTKYNKLIFKMLNMTGYDTYKDMEYVIKEVKSLAKQLKGME